MRCSDRSTASGERRPPVALPLGRGTLWRRLVDQDQLFPPAVDGLHVSAVWSATTGWRLTVTKSLTPKIEATPPAANTASANA